MKAVLRRESTGGETWHFVDDVARAAHRAGAYRERADRPVASGQKHHPGDMAEPVMLTAIC